VLTRLEVDGFKNLVGFGASFGPFTCIAGENGVGKSNIFDAVEFLSLIADRSLLEAAQEVRSTREDSVGEPAHLFTTGGGASPRMRLAAEMILPQSVVDDFGTSVEPSTTFLRYECRSPTRPQSPPLGRDGWSSNPNGSTTSPVATPVVTSASRTRRRSERRS